MKVVLLAVIVAYAAALPTVPVIDTRIDVNGDWRIVGGTDAPSGAYPFIVSIRTSANSHYCGGSIINDEWILTAAHCNAGRTPDDTIVVAGTNTLNDGGSTHNVNTLIIHADYNDFSIANDVGVIRLSTPLSFSNAIAPTVLSNSAVGVEAATIIGWGRTSTGGEIPNNLQHVGTNTITDAECSEWWSVWVSSDQICTLNDLGQGVCNGDSGGPLILTDNQVQIGIMSFRTSTGCAVAFPDVYVKVSAYNSWITDTISS